MKKLVLAPSSRWALLPLLCVTCVAAHSAGRECAHSRKAIVVPSRAPQGSATGAASLRSATSASARSHESDFAPLRIHFDFTHVDNNGESIEQQQYVRGLVEASGAWLR
jgi:hypothetical protein